MISLGSSALSALSPWALAGIPLAAALLVYVYRKKGSSSAQVVSSLFLLQNLPRATPGKKRFVPPLQFWIELAIFIALSCAAATFLLSEKGQHIAVVIDSSLSMAATDGSNTTALERAKTLAQSDISHTLPPVRFTVFESDSALEQLTDVGISSVSALAALSSVEQSFAPDRLATHLESLLRRGGYDAVWTYTDRALQGGRVSDKIKVTTVPREHTETLNFWISALTTKIINNETFLVATTNLSSGTPVRVSLATTCYDAAETFSLPPVTFTQSPSSPIQTKLGPVTQEWSHCNVTGTTSEKNFTDRLNVDNSGWITRGSAATEIALVSDLSAQQLGIARLKNFSFTQRPPIQGAVPMLYHRSLPSSPSEQELRAPTLLVFPPNGSLPWGGTAEELPEKKPLEVSRWDTSHPLLKYVKPTLLRIPSAKKLTCPDSSSAILFSASGPLLCAGERNGMRYAIVGFELFPFDGKGNPTLSIFTLNLFSWLFLPSEFTSLGKQPGALAVPADTTSARYVAPSEEPLTISKAQTVEAEKPGIIDLARGSARELMAINVFSEEESALSRTTPLTLPSESGISSKDSNMKPLDLSPWLALLALLIACADILRRLIRKQRWAS
jgi:hypothetical protein